MVGRPFTVQEWNKSFSSLNGAMVVRMLMPFYACPLELKPSVLGLRMRIRSAYREIGVYVPNVEIISVSRACSEVFGLPKDAQRKLLSRLEDYLVESIKRNLGIILARKFWETFSDSIGENRSLFTLKISASIGKSLERELFLIFDGCVSDKAGETEKNKIHALLFDAAWSSLRVCLYYEIAFLLMGKFEEAAKIAPFIGCFRAGNFPVGMIGPETALVLVA